MEITPLKEVWMCDPNYHKIQRTFALNFSRNYLTINQTLKRVFHQICEHFEVGGKKNSACA